MKGGVGWKRIYGPKRDDVIGDWRKLHEETYNLFPSSNIKEYEMDGASRTCWED